MGSNRPRRFRVFDFLYILMMILPLVFGMILRVLTKPAGGGIEITGAQIYFTVPMPLQSLPVTEAQVNSAIVIAVILGACLYLTHGMRTGIETNRQMAAEWIVEKTAKLVRGNMGEDKYFGGFAPFVGAIMGLSALSSLLTLVGLYPPTSDLNIVGGWALLVFVLITYYKLKCGVGYYLEGFTKPVAVLTPINIVSEIATPVSMAFRHYGNILSGVVISVLLGSALSGLSAMVLSRLPRRLASVPILQIGIPAVLSLYFDIFSGLLQAFIFAMLTMLYISNGFSGEDYHKRKLKKQTSVN